MRGEQLSWGAARVHHLEEGRQDAQLRSGEGRNQVILPLEGTNQVIIPIEGTNQVIIPVKGTNQVILPLERTIR